MQYLKFKNPLNEVYNKFKGSTDNGISELTDISIEIIQVKAETKKCWKKLEEPFGTSSCAMNSWCCRDW